MYRLMKLLKDFKLKVTWVIPNKIWSVSRMKRICWDLIMKKLFQKICLQMIRLKWYWRIVLKITRFSIAMLFAKWNYDIIIILRVLLTRARSGMVICVPYGNGNKTSTGFWEDSTRLPEYYDGTYEYLKSLGIEEI